MAHRKPITIGTLVRPKANMIVTFWYDYEVKEHMGQFNISMCPRRYPEKDPGKFCNEYGVVLALPEMNTLNLRRPVVQPVLILTQRTNRVRWTWLDYVVAV